MIVSYQWLMEYLPEPIPVNELSNILTSIGLEVEALEPSEAIKGSLEGLVIGEVLSCEQHPNADKLKITTVDIGSGAPLNIVCGAPNVAVGQKVIVAPVGTTVHPLSGEPFQIKKAKIRGAESQGMICAEDEIGLGNDHDGIIVLPETAPVGQDARSFYAIPKGDIAIHIGLTPNRSDAMSHIGVARDVCAYLTHHKKGSYAVRQPETGLSVDGGKESKISVSISVGEACRRYTGLSIEGIQVGPSPEWLKRRLATIGIRSINNVVDITNYVLHEYGQPLHAFDADKIKGNRIEVRFMPEGTSFLSLDGKERKLNGNDLMVCDAEDGMCIAGVFGGLHSGVTEDTTRLFLESAYFDPTHIRRTSMAHGLRTDAATHFEKGVDINNLVPALVRAARLIEEIAGGKIASDIVDVSTAKIEPRTVAVTYAYIRKLSGKQYTENDIKNIVVALNFGIQQETTEGLTLLVPTNKTDVLQPADIVEEILRIDGLDNIAIPSRLSISLGGNTNLDVLLYEKLAALLSGEGFQEVVTNSIVNSRYYPGDEGLVRMLNSLSSELDVMRPSMLESGLEVIQYNCNRKNNDLLLFESGKVYRMEENKYKEERQLALWVTGQVRAAHWDQKAEAADIYFLKGVIGGLLRKSGIRDTVVGIEDGAVIWKWKKHTLCRVQQVPARRLQDFDLKQDVFFAILYLEPWSKSAMQHKIKYAEVPRFPSVQRDLALVLDRAVSYEEVRTVTEQLKIEALKDYDLFDVFESEKLGTGKKSLALSYTFQLQDRTLTDAEIEQLMSQLVDSYKTRLQAQIRD